MDHVVDGLRVCEASVIPTVPRSNTNLMVMVMVTVTVMVMAAAERLVERARGSRSATTHVEQSRHFTFGRGQRAAVVHRVVHVG